MNGASLAKWQIAVSDACFGAGQQGWWASRERRLWGLELDSSCMRAAPFVYQQEQRLRISGS